MVLSGRLNKNLHPIAGKEADTKFDRCAGFVDVDAFSDQDWSAFGLVKFPSFLLGRHSGNDSRALSGVVVNAEVAECSGHRSEFPKNADYAGEQCSREKRVGIADSATIRFTGAGNSGDDFPLLDVQGLGHRDIGLGVHGHEQDITRSAVLAGQVLAESGSAAHRIVDDRFADKSSSATLHTDEAVIGQSTHCPANGVAVDGEQVGELAFGRQLLPRLENTGSHVRLNFQIDLAPQGHPVFSRKHLHLHFPDGNHLKPQATAVV